MYTGWFESPRITEVVNATMHMELQRKHEGVYFGALGSRDREKIRETQMEMSSDRVRVEELSENELVTRL